nr:MAG TPA: hypothetical protein [Bacteriophage sp.]
MPPEQFERLDLVVQLNLDAVRAMLDSRNRCTLIIGERVRVFWGDYLYWRYCSVLILVCQRFDARIICCICKGNTRQLLDNAILRHLCTPLEVFLTTCNLFCDFRFSKVFSAYYMGCFCLISCSDCSLCRVKINHVFIYKAYLFCCQFHIVTSLLIKNLDILHLTQTKYKKSQKLISHTSILSTRKAASIETAIRKRYRRRDQWWGLSPNYPRYHITTEKDVYETCLFNFFCSSFRYASTVRATI